MSLSNASWLLIGMGIGVMLGEQGIFKIVFGGVLVISGAILYMVDEKEGRRTNNNGRKEN